MSASKQTFAPLRVERPLGPWIFQDGGGRDWLERKLLPAWLPSRRWFGAKAQGIARVAVETVVSWGDASVSLLVVRVESEGGAVESYAVPLACAPETEFDEGAEMLARGSGADVLCEAIFSPSFRADLLSLMGAGGSVGGSHERVAGAGSAFLSGRWEDVCKQSRVHGAEQSNTSIIYGDRLFLKLFRRMQAGISPDAEISRFLGERRFEHVPPFGGTLELHRNGESTPLGLLLGCVPNLGDAWAWALEAWRQGRASEPATFERIAQLGQRTAEMHLALAADTEDPAFRPEPLTRSDCETLAASVLARLHSVCTALRASAEPLAKEVLAGAEAAERRIASIAALPPGTVKTRHHGDYHLGQVLNTGTDWMIIDFEGEPMRSLEERRARRSPLRDVAGMLRSFHYAAHASRDGDGAEALERAEAWANAAREVFLERYLATAGEAPFLPGVAADRDALLDAFIVEKALYEIDYELNNRPAWLPIPLRGFLAVMR